MMMIIKTTTRLEFVDILHWLLRYGAHGLSSLWVMFSLYKHNKQHRLMRQKGKEKVSSKQDGERWSKHLPQEIMEMILQRLCLNDYLRFGTVCPSWRSAVNTVIAAMRCPPAPQLPQLVMYRIIQPIPMLNLSEHVLAGGRVSKSCHANLFGQYCYGSIEGWLITTNAFLRRPGDFSPYVSSKYEYDKIENFFLNPVSGAKFMLPSQLTISRFESNNCTKFLRKAVASSIPTRSNCIVAAISGNGDLAICRPSDKAWTLVHDLRLFKYQEIAIHDGKLFALTLDVSASLIMFHLNILNDDGLLSPIDKVKSLPNFLSRPSCFNLVADLNYKELSLVVHVKKTNPAEYYHLLKAELFEVYKFDQSHQPDSQWVKLDTLGDRVLFISHGSCMCISTSSDNSPKELRGNCIYFAFDYDCRSTLQAVPDVVGRDIGVFSLADGNINHDLSPVINHSCATRPPVWFMPTIR